MANNSNKLDFNKASGPPIQQLSGAPFEAAPVFYTGFEQGVISIQGGIWALIDGNGVTTTVTNADANSGTYSLQTAPTASASSRAVRSITGSPTVLVVRHYFKIVTAPATSAYLAEINCSTATSDPRFYINPSTGRYEIRVGSATVVATGPLYTTGVWNYIDWKVNVSANPWQITASINGGTPFTGTSSQAADTITVYRIGTGSSTGPAYTARHDDIIISTTEADYPFGAGGTEAVFPNADGTHSAGVNIMENQAGADIGAVAAWSLLDDVPMNTTADYVRQFANGTANYAEVRFPTPSHVTNVFGLRVVLAYMSASTTANQGATIVSRDNFASFDEVYGNPTTRQDMSESSLFYKEVFMTEPAGGWDSTTLSNLRARMGYSGDASPIPQWHGLMIEVAYATLTDPQVVASDSVGVTEGIGVSIAAGGNTLEPSETENITAAEAVALTTSAPQVSPSEAVTIAENQLLAVGTSQVNKSDAVSVAESVTVAIAAIATLAVNKSDAVTVTESKSVTVGAPQVAVSDNATVAEGVALFVVSAGSLSVSVSDAVTISESKATAIITNIAASEDVVVSEAWAAVVGILVNKSDSIGVAESVNVTVLPSTSLNVSKSDSIATSENATVSMTRLISVSDAISLTDNGYAPPVSPSVGTLGVSDAVNVAESASLALSNLQVSVVENVLLSELFGATVSDLQISTSDGVSLGEAVSIILPAATLIVSVSDAVAVTEDKVMAFPSLGPPGFQMRPRNPYWTLDSRPGGLTTRPNLPIDPEYLTTKRKGNR
jgi:hypothetical protein